MAQIVVITGAGAGLGLSLAERFVKRGDTVYGATLTKRHWKQARKKISSFEQLLLNQVDVTSEVGVKQFVSKVTRKERRIDILINNAGYANRPTPLENESLGEFKKNLSANLISTFLMCKHTLPFFKKENRGWIINIASMAGKRAVPLLSAYSASKFGVPALTQAIAKENPDAGFRCITVCPGGMNTEMRAKLFGEEDARRQQSTDFVANKILEILEGKIPMPNGGDIIIRHNQIAAINPLPEA